MSSIEYLKGVFLVQIDCNKIILINFFSQQKFKYEDEEKYGFNPSFSLISLGTWLEFHGYHVILIDLFAEQMDKQTFINQFKSQDILFVGCSILTENVNISKNIVHQIKQINPNLCIVAGGPHATLCPEELVSSVDVDFVSIGEGESTLLELACAIQTDQKWIAFDKIPGLVYMSGGKSIETPIRNSILDMDILPILKREFFDINRYRKIVNMMSGRGCPGSCIYCAAGVLSGKSYRARSIENVYLEVLLLKYLVGEKLERIYFVDDTFTIKKERVLLFIKYLKDYDVKINWMCQSRMDTIDQNLIDVMSESGCKELLFGVESGNQDVINKIKKNISLKRVWEILEYTYQKKIHIQCSFILGHYCDTKVTMQDTYLLIKKIYDHFRADIAIYLNTPYPGTWQYINRKELGIRIVETDYSKYTNLNPIIETDEFTREDQIFFHRQCLSYFTRFMTLNTIKEKLLKDTR